MTRYASWADLLDYCRRSANPVGRLVLRIAGRATRSSTAWSDAICTALQLTNFWQDLQSRFRSRAHLSPAREQLRARRAARTISRARRMHARLAAALAAAVARTRALFDAGRPAVRRAVDGRLRYELRATWLGGTRILDRLARAGST